MNVWFFVWWSPVGVNRWVLQAVCQQATDARIVAGDPADRDTVVTSLPCVPMNLEQRFKTPLPAPLGKVVQL